MYRKGDGGARFIRWFLSWSKAKKGQSIIEFGCGEGKISYELTLMGYNVTPVDIADNCLNKVSADFFKDKFIRQDFSDDFLPTADFAFSVDTMEHIPPKKVDAAMDNILKACKGCFFQICTVPDALGKHIGETLHLSVHNHTWWENKFIEKGATIFYCKKKISHSLFYVGIE